MNIVKYNNLFYTTSTVLNWKKVLQQKDILVHVYSIWSFLAKDNRVKIYAYAIMPDHVHWIYEVISPYSNEEIKHSFLSFSSKLILESITSKEDFLVNKSTRKYQFWKSPSLSVEIESEKFLAQKMNYIHNNPIAANLEMKPEDFINSSFRYYLQDIEKPEFLTLW